MTTYREHRLSFFSCLADVNQICFLRKKNTFRVSKVFTHISRTHYCNYIRSTFLRITNTVSKFTHRHFQFLKVKYQIILILLFQFVCYLLLTLFLYFLINLVPRTNPHGFTFADANFAIFHLNIFSRMVKFYQFRVDLFSGLLGK